MLDSKPGRTPAQESARLHELLSLDILDTQREERFDRYTRLLVDIFAVPAAWISLIDRDRQWFKSEVGMAAFGTETPRDISFCTHAIDESEALEVPDTLKDDFFRDHPLVQGEPGIRFYFGAVLRGPTGEPIGTLCIYDHKPRRLKEGERRWVLALARMVEADLIQHQELGDNRDLLQHVALNDLETGLPQLHQMINELQAYIDRDQTGTETLVMHLLVENLDDIARAYGPQLRRRFLQALIERLRGEDYEIPAVGRAGAMSLALAVPLAGREAEELALEVLAPLTKAIKLDGHWLRAQIRAGVTRYPGDGEQADSLLSRARLALGLPSYYPGLHFFNRSNEVCLIRRHQIESRIEQALYRKELEQHYQPLFAADGETLVGVEALARWTDEELGRVSPGEFIPIVETSSHLSHLLTYWALNTAIAQTRTWQRQHPGAPLYVGINIPAREFYRDDFVKLVFELLEQHELAPHWLMLELTEESLVENIEYAVESMAALRAGGVRIALDDFGTGYSSLNYLRRLPVDFLKIDKSFIDDLPDSAEASGLVQGIIDIARGLKLKVVAEGVERPEQLTLLRELGCDVIQGYLLGRPGPAAELSLGR